MLLDSSLMTISQVAEDVYKRQMDEYWNPNGSYMAIEGITSPDGRILGKMAHSERRGEAVAMNIYGEQDCLLYTSRYMRKHFQRIRGT